MMHGLGDCSLLQLGMNTAGPAVTFHGPPEDLVLKAARRRFAGFFSREPARSCYTVWHGDHASVSRLWQCKSIMRPALSVANCPALLPAVAAFCMQCSERPAGLHLNCKEGGPGKRFAWGCVLVSHCCTARLPLCSALAVYLHRTTASAIQFRSTSWRQNRFRFGCRAEPFPLAHIIERVESKRRGTLEKLVSMSALDSHRLVDWDSPFLQPAMRVAHSKASCKSQDLQAVLRKPAHALHVLLWRRKYTPLSLLSNFCCAAGFAVEAAEHQTSCVCSPL